MLNRRAIPEKQKTAAPLPQRGNSAAAARRLLSWYDRSRRDLPWRAPPGVVQDPYKVWLSEIMLQQTTVQAVKAYYERFLRLWPDFAALAAAPIDEVMKAWAGLGYYSRARNLHACAKVVVDEHDGKLPGDVHSLRSLPGIGPYTSAAIAAIAFGKRTVVVDANIERVVSRLFEIHEPLPGAKTAIGQKMEILTPRKRAGDFAQAMMDLGAGVCTVKKPACALCPLLDLCAAGAAGTGEEFPVKPPKAAKPLRRGAVFFLERADGKVLMRTRPPKGLLGGMAEFPGTDWSADFVLRRARAHAPVQADWKKQPGVVEHVFTHFALELTVYTGIAPRGLRAPKGMRWVAGSHIGAEALPTLMRKVVVFVEKRRL